MNIPNKITMFRMLLVPVFVVVMLVQTIPYNNVIACAIFAIACSTDWLDGHLARKWNMTTSFGKLMDPLADKLLVCSALILFVYMKTIPAWVVIVIIAREFIISGYRQLAVEKGVVIAANYWGKSKTVVQMIMSILLILQLPGQGIYVVEQVLIYLAVILTVISLATYVWSNRAILSD